MKIGDGFYRGIQKDLKFDIEIDMRRIERAAFGFFRWRLKAAQALFWLAAYVLPSNIEVKTQ